LTDALTGSAAETEAVGARLAETLEPGDVVLITGELGAGKTTLVRGACRALGVEEPIVSPTFTLGRRYAGRHRVSHLDLYRLSSLADEEPGFLDDYLGVDVIAFVEWPEAGEPELGEAARRIIRVRMEHLGGESRRIALEGP
jgi:tRNA threonylcarbamoyladenosine biosynthesis protein TsaE